MCQVLQSPRVSLPKRFFGKIDFFCLNGGMVNGKAAIGLMRLQVADYTYTNGGKNMAARRQLAPDTASAFRHSPGGQCEVRISPSFIVFQSIQKSTIFRVSRSDNSCRRQTLPSTLSFMNAKLVLRHQGWSVLERRCTIVSHKELYEAIAKPL